MAYERYAANFKKCTFALDILKQREMVDETEATIYGSATALKASPSIAAFYPSQRYRREHSGLPFGCTTYSLRMHRLLPTHPDRSGEWWDGPT